MRQSMIIHSTFYMMIVVVSSFTNHQPLILIPGLSYHIDMANKDSKDNAQCTTTLATVQRRDDVGDPVGETTYRRIRTDIIFGKLSPGQKLILDRMKEVYGASVSTLREILNRLSAES